jgi:hypothetical protein
MDRSTAWALIEAARVATLGTIRAGGRPHVVPCVFALADPLIYIPVDAKPKRTRELLRLTNLEANPHAVILVTVVVGPPGRMCPAAPEPLRDAEPPPAAARPILAVHRPYRAEPDHRGGHRFLEGLELASVFFTTEHDARRPR